MKFILIIAYELVYIEYKVKEPTALARKGFCMWR